MSTDQRLSLKRRLYILDLRVSDVETEEKETQMSDEPNWQHLSVGINSESLEFHPVQSIKHFH